MEQKIKIVMLVGEAKSSTFMYNGLSKDFVIEKVVRETPVSMKQILKNRAKRVGYFNVFGQILFGVLLLPIIRKFSKNQLAKVLETQQLDSKPIPEDKIISVNSVNSDESLKILKELRVKFPKAKIQGHRDFPNVKKACPSFDAQKEYEEIFDIFG